jgi:AcrR family transcriptional regulator
LAVVKTASAAGDDDSLSRNLLGQRIGRKGRDTRARILAATERLLAERPGAGITFSAVAREARLGMTALYAYFTDLSELLGAVLEPVMDSAEDSYVTQLRSFWPDESLGDHCRTFVESYYAFWVRHSGILHMRNTYADNGDPRMWRHRLLGSTPLTGLLVQQMEGDPDLGSSPAHQMAEVLLIGVERMVTVVTGPTFADMVKRAKTARRLTSDPATYVSGLVTAETRLVELAIADGRANARRAAGA